MQWKSKTKNYIKEKAVVVMSNMEIKKSVRKKYKDEKKKAGKVKTKIRLEKIQE